MLDVMGSMRYKESGSIPRCLIMFAEMISFEGMRDFVE